MGLTNDSTGNACKKYYNSDKKKNFDLTVALAGNPNVGKSTVFNQLTGMHQHTGNWSGKTVGSAAGELTYNGKNILLTDIPGCYSLNAHSPEEEIARDILCYSGIDKTVVVCDATLLKRNLCLVLQTIEMVGSCIVCINLADEAKLRNIEINTKLLSDILSVPVVTTTARSGKGLKELCEIITSPTVLGDYKIKYPNYIEQTLQNLCKVIEPICKNTAINTRWIALKLIENREETNKIINNIIGEKIYTPQVNEILEGINEFFEINSITKEKLSEILTTSIIKSAEEIAEKTVITGENKKEKTDQKIDKILTGKFTAFPIMLLMLMGIFYITIIGANIPSRALSKLFFSVENYLYNFCLMRGVSEVICDALFCGVFRTLTWIVSVMLPPMAIFFPLFTLLEDGGILPRIAFNLDRAFEKCKTCGKQALTMCMGFGCNAAGVVGCRIIDSPREQIIAIITNAFVPCNGRFPGIISMIALFLVFGGNIFSEILSAALLTAFIAFSILVTLTVSKILSKTLLKGLPSSFTLELPPYRRPQFFRVLVRSIFDRTLFVLSRAVVVAAPAGLIIWLLANISLNDVSLLSYITNFLEPFGKLLGLDGVIITAFLLGFPANEIVIPIMLMAYTASGSLAEFSDTLFIKTLLVDNGWTVLTALNFIIFSLFHFPCSTTLLTIKKETGSLAWTALSFILPTAVGIIICIFTNLLYSIFF